MSSMLCAKSEINGRKITKSICITDMYILTTLQECLFVIMLQHFCIFCFCNYKDMRSQQILPIICKGVRTAASKSLLKHKSF